MRYIKSIAITLFIAGTMLGASGCSPERTDAGISSVPAAIVLTARISVDPSELDTYVSKIRLIGFGRDDGSLVCNSMYNTLSPTADGTVVFTESVRRTGLRIYVLANETAEMTAKLDYVYNESDFLALDAVSRIEFTPGWEPAPDSPFLMSDLLEIDAPALDAEGAVSVNASLERMQAKLSFSLSNEYSATQTEGAITYITVVKVSDVRIINVPQYQSAVLGQGTYNYQYLSAAIPLVLGTGGVYGAGTWENTYETVYLPEHLLADNDPEQATAVCFSAERSFVNAADPADIKVTTAKHYVVPVQAPLGLGKGMDYSVRRNSHYHMDCKITGWDEGPVITAEVVPWTYHKVEVDFDTPDFDIIPRGVEMMDGHPVIRGRGGDVVYALKLKGPKGATWRATISNGLDFDLINSDEYVWSGRVDPDAFALIRVVATKDYMEGQERVTDLIIRVNEKEAHRIENITLQPEL